MQEIKLNHKYKYTKYGELEDWMLFINEKPAPQRPENVYKFYDTNLNSIASLHEAYFWLSNPKDFNDPFDCNLNLIEFENTLSIGVSKHRIKNDIPNFGVSCFTEIINEPLLWAHYSNNYKGFAIEFNPETIRVSLNHTERKASFNPVLYMEEFVRIKNTEEIALEYFLTAKSDRWAYEKEWRFITEVDENKPYDRIIFYEPISIKALYIGHRIYDEHISIFNLIESIFKTKYPDKPTYIVHPHPFKLELSFVERDY